MKSSMMQCISANKKCILHHFLKRKFHKLVLQKTELFLACPIVSNSTHKVASAFSGASNSRLSFHTQHGTYSRVSELKDETKRLCNKSMVNGKPQSFFNKDGLIAVNKPQFLSVFGSSGEGGSDSLRQMMEQRAKADGSFFEVGLSLKSFYSGVVLFCNDSLVKAQLDKSLSGAMAQKKFSMTYLAITVGRPQCPSNKVLEECIAREYLHNRQISVVCPVTSNSARKAGKMMAVNYMVKPLLVSEESGAALVEISLSKDKWECVEVLLSHHRSFVLGDTTYASRTHTIMGVPFSTSPYTARPGTQRLPPQMETILSTQGQGASSTPPLCVHRHKIILSNFPRKGCPPLVLTASPPPHFMSTLRALGLYSEPIFREIEVEMVDW